MQPIFAFACRMRGNEHETIYNLPTASKAKSEYLRDVQDCYPDAKYTDVRVRKLGGPHTSDEFRRNAKYRGMPDLECGQRVMIDEWPGTIVGHNYSANFDVLMDPGSPYGDCTLNAHPMDVTLLPANDQHNAPPWAVAVDAPVLRLAVED